MPEIPTPGPTLRTDSGDIPRPRSVTCSTTASSSQSIRTAAVGLPEWCWTLLRHSWTTRKIVVSSSCAILPSRGERSIETLMPLRRLKESAYHRSADSRPTSSSKGGWSREARSRSSREHSSASAWLSVSALRCSEPRVPETRSRTARFIASAETFWAVLSWSSRAIRRCSSSLNCSSRPESSCSARSVSSRCVMSSIASSTIADASGVASPPPSWRSLRAVTCKVRCRPPGTERSTLKSLTSAPANTSRTT